MNCVCLSFQPVRLEYEQKKWRREINEVKIKKIRERAPQKKCSKKKKKEETNVFFFLWFLVLSQQQTLSDVERVKDAATNNCNNLFGPPIGRSQHLEKENVVPLRVVDSSDKISIPRRERTREREQKLIEIAPVDDARFAFQLVILATYLKKGDGASSTRVSCFSFFKIKPVFFIPRKKNTKKKTAAVRI